MSSSTRPIERPPFPLYLLPSLPFPRRRVSKQAQTTNTYSGASSASLISPLSSPSSLPQSISPSSIGSATSRITQNGIGGAYTLSDPSTENYAEIWLDASPDTYQPTPESTASTSLSTQSTPSTSPPAPTYPKLSHLNSHPKTGLHALPPILCCASCSTDIAFASQIISKGFTGRHGRAYLLSPLPTKSRRGAGVGGGGRGIGLGAENCASTSSPRLPAPGRFSLLDPFGSFSSSNTSNSISNSGAGEGQGDGQGEGERYDLLNIQTQTPSRRQLVTGLHVVADISCRVCERVLGWKYVDATELGQRYKIGKFILETKRVVGGGGWEDACAEDENRGDELGLAIGRKGSDEDDGVNAEVEFDSADEEECEEIFAGVWDREVVKMRRAKKGELERKRGV